MATTNNGYTIVIHNSHAWAARCGRIPRFRSRFASLDEAKAEADALRARLVGRGDGSAAVLVYHRADPVYNAGSI